MRTLNYKNRKKIFLITFIFLPAFLFGITNSMTIKEEAGITTTNYPVQIARPFLKGEITSYPQVLINGTAVKTQADVKQRYSDGSVKHAIITFLIPTLTANAIVTITFKNQTTGNNTGFLTSTGMLAAAYNFDASMELTNGSTKIVSARTMVQSNDFTYWMKGSVATSVIVADHSINRKYDLGFDAYKPFRPIFHATFWPGINKVRIRFIGEASNSEEFEDIVYSLALKMGFTSPASVYTKNNMTHYAGSRWTKEYWIGGQPSKISIGENLGYLKETMFFPNYDVSKVISSSTITTNYTNWQKVAKDLYDAGNFQKAMGTAGGRPDIGPLCSWTVKWLYTADWRTREQAFVNADLAAAWPMNIRECNPVKKILRSDTSISGLGHVVSLTKRPTTNFTTGYNYSFTKPADRIKVVGTVTNGGWAPDNAHQPDPYSPQYILSGDYWYLEQMYMWAAWTAHLTNGAATNYNYGRGPTGAEGGVNGQLRGNAWTLRNRSITAFCAPDVDVEKKYFSELVDDALAVYEGQRNIKGTSFYNNLCWAWGYKMSYLPAAMGYPKLNQWDAGSSAFAQAGYGIDTAVTKSAISNFEQHFMMFALGRAIELGFAADSLTSYLAKNYIGQVTGTGYNPYLLANGRLPTIRKSDGQYFDTWANLKTGYDASWENKNSFPKSDAEHGYDFLGLTAVSYVACEPGGAKAWQFVDTAILSAPILNTNPKWAIVPRTCSSIITAINELKQNNAQVLIYPNPSNGNFRVSLNSDYTGEVIFSVKNMLGQIVKREVINKTTANSENVIDLEGEAKGIYFLEVQTENELSVLQLIKSGDR